jgi:hypothetical protein
VTICNLYMEPDKYQSFLHGAKIAACRADWGQRRLRKLKVSQAARAIPRIQHSMPLQSDIQRRAARTRAAAAARIATVINPPATMLAGVSRPSPVHGCVCRCASRTHRAFPRGG